MRLNENKCIPKAFELHGTFDFTLHFKQNKAKSSVEKILLHSTTNLCS
jgi:hypothetical protein